MRSITILSFEPRVYMVTSEALHDEQTCEWGRDLPVCEWLVCEAFYLWTRRTHSDHNYSLSYLKELDVQNCMEIGGPDQNCCSFCVPFRFCKDSILENRKMNFYLFRFERRETNLIRYEYPPEPPVFFFKCKIRQSHGGGKHDTSTPQGR